jgi:hypothetical protein
MLMHADPAKAVPVPIELSFKPLPQMLWIRARLLVEKAESVEAGTERPTFTHCLARDSVGAVASDTDLSTSSLGESENCKD